MDSTKYRPDIDGLRALAVLSVVAFHLGLPGFPGGYVGVDIFFVISGFLITRLIVDEYEQTGTLDFSAFYIRRARRLLPALLLTLAVTLAVAALLFPQSLMSRTAASAIYSLLSLSNFYFWSEADYFDVEAIAKPLLHTWSLSVEEQFYLLWPATLLFLLRFKSRAPLLLALLIGGAASLYLNLVFADGDVADLSATAPRLAEWFDDGRATIFFLPFFRVFEFAIGAAMVWLVRAKPRNAGTLEILSFAGLGLIGWAVFAFTEETVFPSFNALLPCLGAALLIYAGEAPVAGRLLGNRLAVGIGKISYSLYLIHWPLIVFYSQIRLVALNLAEMAALALLSVALAAAMYRYVEQPFRQRLRLSGRLADGAYLKLCALCGFAMTVIALSAVVDDGWRWRIPPDRRAMTPVELRAIESSYCGEGENSETLFTCVADRGAKESIYVWGDSHARHLIGGLAKVFQNQNIRVLYHSSCVPQSGLFGFFHDYQGRDRLARNCAQRNREALDYFSRAEPATIIFHSYLRDGDTENRPLIDATNRLVATLAGYGHDVKTLSDVIRPGKMLVDCYSVPAIYSDDLLEQRCVGDPLVAQRLRAANDRLEELLRPGSFINLNGAFCDQEGCAAFRDGKPLFRDEHHLTVFGAETYIRAAKDFLFPRVSATAD